MENLELVFTNHPSLLSYLKFIYKKKKKKKKGSWKLLVLFSSPIRTQNSHGVFGKGKNMERSELGDITSI